MPFPRPTLVLSFILLVFMLAQEWLLAPHGSGSLAIKVVPLALILPALARGSVRGYKILALMIWLYVLEAATLLYAPMNLAWALALLQLLLCLVIFASVLRFVRK